MKAHSIFFAFALLLLPSLLAAHPKPKIGKIVHVKHFANLRKLPKIGAKILQKLPKGAKVTILKTNLQSQNRQIKWRKKFPLWHKVRYKNFIGFVAASFVRILPPTHNQPSSTSAPVVVWKNVGYLPGKKYQDLAETHFQKGQILLTFDDGPRIGVTEKILDTLKKYNLQAIFFVNGYALRNMRRKKRSLFKRIIQEGHLIGNHTDRHKNLSKLSWRQIQQEIENCSKEIQTEFQYIGATWSNLFFRFPMGAWKHKDGSDLRKLIYRRYKWIYATTKIHGKDWKKGRSPYSILKTLKKLALARGKGTLTLHELPNSARALEKFIPWAISQGFRFVKIQLASTPNSRITRRTPNKPNQPTPQLGGYSDLPNVNISSYLRRTKYHNLYQKWGKIYGIDWRLLKAFAIVESSERPHLVNRFGYTGLFQIGKSALKTFNRRMKKKYTMNDMKNPNQNTEVAAWLTHSNLKILSRPNLLGILFLQHPVHYAAALYSAHNYGIGLTKKAIEKLRKNHLPLRYKNVFASIEKAGKSRYGRKAGALKMKVAKKTAAIYLQLLQHYPQP
ncbi:MAG: hypothetical protein D6805_03900 [Planctomycetota bacterium]|nr:MAG: hypothetical protein D6805_03900 [Planctomycetota bacterium]